MYKMADILTLDDNKEYVVAADFPYEGKNYLLMTEFDDPRKALYFEYEKNGEDVTLTEVEDEEIIMSLMKVVHDKVVGEESE